MAPRILLIDIETAPCLGYTWGMYEQNVIDLEHSWYILCFAAKWLGEKKTKTWALPDYSEFSKNKRNDKALCSELWRLMDEADIIVAHNGDRFDIKKINARLLHHSFKPPSPYKTIDTIKVARRRFAFVSNRLNDLGKYLGVGAKLPHTGFHLWKGCMEGDRKSWALMRRYNARDVDLLEQVYLKLRAWEPGHPNLSLYSGEVACPTCQSKRIQRRGFNFAKSRITQRMQCLGCGAWFSGKKAA